jgi:hypothetical protein
MGRGCLAPTTAAAWRCGSTTVHRLPWLHVGPGYYCHTPALYTAGGAAPLLVAVAAPPSSCSRPWLLLQESQRPTTQVGDARTSEDRSQRTGLPGSASRALGKKKDSLYFFSPLSIRIHLHTTLFATSTCGANVCKWALCTTTSFQLRDYTGCIRHVFVLGQCSMVTIRGCGSILRALGVSQILVFVATGRCSEFHHIVGQPAAGNQRRGTPHRELGHQDNSQD